MAESFRCKMTASTTADANGDFGSVHTDFPSIDVLFPEGTSASQVDVTYFATVTLAASGVTNLDLQAFTGADGASKSLAEVRAFIIRARSANNSKLTLSPNSTNGWTGLLQDASDILDLPVGANIWIVCGTDGAIPVTASNKVLDITNTDGSNTATYDLMIAGTSA